LAQGVGALTPAVDPLCLRGVDLGGFVGWVGGAGLGCATGGGAGQSWGRAQGSGNGTGVGPGLGRGRWPFPVPGTDQMGHVGPQPTP
jgi:hypothetical protein